MASYKGIQEVTLEKKLDDVLKAINKLSGKITSLEKNFQFLKVDLIILMINTRGIQKIMQPVFFHDIEF